MPKKKNEQLTNAIGDLMNKARELHGQDAPESAPPTADTPSGVPPARTFAFRLSGAGSLKIDAVILNTQKATRQRVTVTDVLNYALDCLPETAINLDQVNAMRAKDGRRRRRKSH